MTGPAPCRVLEWDSEFFGHRIARVEAAKMDATTRAEIWAFARAESIECFYFLVDAADVDSNREAEAAGFRCVDVRVTRERRVDEGPLDMPGSVDEFRDTDLPALKAIARASHGASRFYHDPNFSRERCDALYDAWISKACSETPENVLVVRRCMDAVGYLTCEFESATLGSIGLVAVAESERGQHLGVDLVRGSLSFFARNERERVRVVSQERNIASARLYEGLGFRTTRIENWYHFWPDGGDRT